MKLTIDTNLIYKYDEFQANLINLLLNHQDKFKKNSTADLTKLAIKYFDEYPIEELKTDSLYQRLDVDLIYDIKISSFTKTMAGQLQISSNYALIKEAADTIAHMSYKQYGPVENRPCEVKEYDINKSNFYLKKIQELQNKPEDKIYDLHAKNTKALTYQDLYNLLV